MRVKGPLAFPHAPHDGQYLAGQGMQSIAVTHSISYHPFVVSLKDVIAFIDNGSGSADHDVFEGAIAARAQFESGRFGSAPPIGTALAAFEPYAAVLEEFAFGLEPPGGFQIGV